LDFYYIKPKALSPFLDLMLRGFQLTFGRFGLIGDFLKKLLRDKLITKTNKSEFKFSRVFDFMRDKVIITDSFNVDKIKKIIIGSKSSYIYVPSSRYFQKVDLDLETLFFREAKTVIREINKSGRINIYRK
jgi:hypothetical protein